MKIEDIRLTKEEINKAYMKGDYHLTFRITPEMLCGIEATANTATDKAIKEILRILEDAMAGLAIDHPEYYEKQEFVVMPLKYLQSLKKLLDKT
uniref:Uncharacterized protein n=1 Tax=viral metagenome TaxID=1070528 RepID=A0A6M3LHQ4_9ZZZZ